MILILWRKYHNALLTLIIASLSYGIVVLLPLVNTISNISTQISTLRQQVADHNTPAAASPPPPAALQYQHPDLYQIIQEIMHCSTMLSVQNSHFSLLPQHNTARTTLPKSAEFTSDNPQDDNTQSDNARNYQPNSYQISLAFHGMAVAHFLHALQCIYTQHLPVQYQVLRITSHASGMRLNIGMTIPRVISITATEQETLADKNKPNTQTHTQPNMPQNINEQGINSPQHLLYLAYLTRQQLSYALLLAPDGTMHELRVGAKLAQPSWSLQRLTPQAAVFKHNGTGAAITIKRSI